MYRLRFDVETISKATINDEDVFDFLLRFDVETISKATFTALIAAPTGCGLM